MIELADENGDGELNFEEFYDFFRENIDYF
jgi:Ca2+-binding EF-hand superfamily protein